MSTLYILNYSGPFFPLSWAINWLLGLDWGLYCVITVWFCVHVYSHVCLWFFSPGWQDTFGAGNPDVSFTHLSAAAGARGWYHRTGQAKQVRHVTPHGVCLEYGWQMSILIIGNLLCPHNFLVETVVTVFLTLTSNHRGYYKMSAMNILCKKRFFLTAVYLNYVVTGTIQTF